MNEEARMAALDARLRRAMSGLDTGEGFSERLHARIAAIAPRAQLGAVLACRQEALHRRLRLQAWANGISVAGLGLAMAATVWRFAPEIERLAAGLPSLGDPLIASGVAFAVIAVCLAPILRLLPRVRFGRLALR
ncbi:MAG: hypothetical protein ACT4UP_08610 [Gammaproteobacteria bacterium]